MPSTSYTATSPGRLVTKQNTVGAVILATTANTNTSSAGAFGSWAALTSSTGAEYAITAISVYCPSGITAAQQPLIVSLGYGASGSETELGQRHAAFETMSTSSEFHGTIQLGIPWRVAAGVRLAARVSWATTANGGFTIRTAMLPWTSLEGN